MKSALFTLPFLVLLNPVVPAALVGLGWSEHAVAGTISARSLVGVWKVQLDRKQKAAAIASQIALRATEYSDAEIAKLGLDVAEIRKINRQARANENVGVGLLMSSLLPDLTITLQQGVVTWKFGSREYSKSTYKVKSVVGNVVTTAETPTKPAPGGGVWAPTSSTYNFVNETQFTLKHPVGRTLTFKKTR